MSYQKYNSSGKFSKQQMFFIDKQEKAKEKSKLTTLKVNKDVKCEKCKIELSQSDIDIMEPEEFIEPIYCDSCALKLAGEEN
jgi:hypothetical protein